MTPLTIVAIRWGTVLIVVIGVAALPTVLKAESLPIKNYTTADGLPSDRINRIVTDSRGFLWFCTPEGLSRFDGHQFVNYGVEQGLPDRAVTVVRESRSGDRWIGTARGLSRLSKVEHTDGRLSGPTMPFNSIGLGGDSDGSPIVALAPSRSGGLWVATDSAVFAWTEAAGFQPRDVLSAAQHAARVHITDVVEAADGSIWIGTDSGIVVKPRRGEARMFTVRDGLPGDWVETLVQDSSGRMWAGVRGGLVEFRVEPGGGSSIAKVYTTELAGTGVTVIAEASDRTLWVGTSQGISRLRWPSAGAATVENLTRAEGLSDRWITALAEDQAGNMWVGTESGGAMRVSRLGFTTYHESDGLSSDRVWSVVQGRAGEVLAVTVRQGSRSVDLLNGRRFRMMAPGGIADHPPWGWNQVLLQSRTGEWWAATAEGLCRFGRGPAATLDRRNPDACYARETTVFSIFEDSRGGIWASAQSATGDRLFRWSPQTNGISEFPSAKVSAEPRPLVADDLVTAFAEDQHANVWMGLYKGGLYRYDGRDFQHFEEKDGVPRGRILALLSTSSGLWIGSERGGLGRIVDTGVARPRVEPYGREAALSSDIVECLVDDGAGHIYAGTGKGVDRIDPATSHIRHFTTADGLPHGECHGALLDASRSLWFATTQGLSRFMPGEDPPPVAPGILITGLRIGGEPYGVSELGESRIAASDLAPSQNQVQVDFVGLDYEPGVVVRYSYKLDGADTTWSPPQEQPSVSYAALKPGTYRFHVKAVTSMGAESDAPAEVDFVVLSPMWRRWWFVSLAALSVLGLGVAAHRYRVAHVVSLERMRTAIATDLHDDIGARLSQIAILSEVARLTDGRGSAEPLERVASLARELVDSIGDIVWSIRSEPGDGESLIRHMREFALDVLGSQGIDFQLRTPSSPDGMQMSLQLRRQLLLMFKECIHNAARHSRSTAVTAAIAIAAREVRLTVEDNGIGLGNTRAESAASGGTGIQGMHRRAATLGGQVIVTSAPGGGCRVEIRLPLGRRVRAARLS